VLEDKTLHGIAIQGYQISRRSRLDSYWSFLIAYGVGKRATASVIKSGKVVSHWQPVIWLAIEQSGSGRDDP
jgi:hypothetical protein